MPILVISLYQIGKLFSSLFDKIFKIVVINVYIHNILCFRAFLQAKKGFFGVFMRLIIIYASLKKETINRPPYIGRPKIYRRALVGHGGIRVILFWVLPQVLPQVWLRAFPRALPQVWLRALPPIEPQVLRALPLAVQAPRRALPPWARVLRVLRA